VPSWRPDSCRHGLGHYKRVLRCSDQGGGDAVAVEEAPADGHNLDSLVGMVEGALPRWPTGARVSAT